MRRLKAGRRTAIVMADESLLKYMNHALPSQGERFETSGATFDRIRLAGRYDHDHDAILYPPAQPIQTVFETEKQKEMKRLISLALCALCFAAGMSAQDIDQKILKLQKEGNTYTAPFTETKVMPKLKKENVKKGELTWQADENLRMDYNDPAGDYKEIAPGIFNIKQNGRVQKLPAKDSNTRTGVLRQTLLLSFRGEVEEVAALNRANASYADKGGRYVCALTADQPRHGVKSLVLEYDKKNGHLLLLTITESSGNYTTWEVK